MSRGRAFQVPGPSAGERRRLRQSQRARAHLARVRARHGGRRGRLLPAVAVLAGSLALGALAGPLLAGVALRLAAVRLDAVHVRGAARVPAEGVAAAAGLARGAALADVDPQGVAQRLAEQPWIARARALRWVSGALLVEVVERQAEALVAVGADLYAVDGSGLPFAPATPREAALLPTLEPADPVRTQRAQERLARAVDLLHRMAARGLPAPEAVAIGAELDTEGFALRLPELPAPIVLGWRDLDGPLARLGQLLAARPEGLAGAAAIDLRFEDQAVLREGPTPDGEGTSGGEARMRDAVHGTADRQIRPAA